MIQSLANFLRRRQQKWNSGQMLSILAHSSLEVHCSYRLKFFVAKNHLRSSSPSNCSLLCSRFARSCSPRPSQRSKYTEGVALRMRICIAVQRLSRKWVQKKIRNRDWKRNYFMLPSVQRSRVTARTLRCSCSYFPT